METGGERIESIFQVTRDPQVDTTYGVHPNLKIHTGACKYFGYGMVHCKSRKQKLNTKSSTASEVVGVSD